MDHTLQSKSIASGSGGRMRLAVIIINYKTAELVIQCLVSCLGQLSELDGHVIIVDNCSQDDSVRAIGSWLAMHDDGKRVRVIEAKANAGFSAGNNIGILAADADYYLLLNSDTIIRPGAIAILIKSAEQHPEAGILSPRLESLSGTPQHSCFRYLSPVSEFIDAAKTGPLTRALNRFDVPLPLCDAVISPQWTSFACALLRRELLDEIGLMDAGFFMYFEDAEYCRRAHKAGWNIVHNPKARVVHLCGGSSEFNRRVFERKRLPRYYYASRSRYFYLAYGWLGLTSANILWSLGRCVSKCRETLGRRESGVAEKQWLDIWTNCLNPMGSWSHKSQVTS